MKLTVQQFIITLAAICLGVTIASAGSNDEHQQLKQKIDSGIVLTDAELQRAIEITESGNPLNLQKARAAGNQRTLQTPRRPANPLDEYIWTPVNYEWVDIGDVGINTGLSQDDEFSGPYDLGFNITFYDQTYNQVWVCSNGWVSFVLNDFPAYTNGQLPDPFTPNTGVYAFWDDLYLPNGGQVIYYEDSVNDRFIVTWEAVPHIGTTDEIYTFQIVISSDGNVRYNYNSIFDAGFYGNFSCTSGIENQDGSEGVQVCFDGTGTLPVSESSIVVGQPDGVPGPVTNLTAQIVGEDVAFNWVNPTEDTNGNPITLTNIQVWWGHPSNGILLATLGGTVTTYTHVNPPDGNHTYYVRAFANPYYGSPASVNAIVGSPSYVEDFENTSGLWEAPQGGWEWGDITNPGLFGAHSGTKVWAVGLATNYLDNSCYYLDLDVGLAVTSPTATIELWVSWSTESWWDGCNFKASTDGGTTWEVITPENGYEQPALSPDNACIPNEPGWSNFGINWHLVILPIGQFEGEAPIFRFSFGADPIINYPGFAIDDMIIWGLAPPIGAPVSGTVTLDGGAGSITAVAVHANGLGNPTANPAANGTYTLNNVLVGNRIIWANLFGYHDDSENIVLPEGGATGVDLTLVRLDPPAPTALTASVDNDNGLVTLDWDNSADPLVDNYNLYRKLQDDENWTLVGNVIPSNATHQLPVDGVYLMAVSAVDVDVSTPVESELSAEVTILYGSIPPTGLNANGNFDDRIRLSWFPPGTPPEFELFYDDGTNEVGGIGWGGTTPPFGWLVAKYQGNGSVTVTRLKMFFSSQAIPGDPFEVGVFADAGGVPTTTPLGVVQATQEAPFDEYREYELDPPVNFPDGIFYVGCRQTSFNSISCGGDNNSPFVNNTFMYNYDATAWTTYEAISLFTIPMQRCYAIGQFDQEIELTPGQIAFTHLPFDMSEIRGTEWSKTIAENKFASQKSANASSKTSAFSKSGRAVYTTPSHVPAANASGELTSMDVLQLQQRARRAVAPHAPNVTPVSERDPDHSLDDLDYYIVYRGGVDIAHPTATTYEDLGRTENVDYVYTVAAHYDNGEVSSVIGPVTAHCNMAPAAPTNLVGTPIGNTQMRLTWTNPTLNADATPCIDRAGTRVYRDGAQIADLGATATEYIDTPPENDQLYVWSVVAKDEVPNLSAESIPFEGFVVSPWEVVNYEWIDIGDIGSQTGITGIDQNVGPFDLGFDFEYMGNTYNSCRVQSGGCITFTDFDFEYNNTELPNPATPNNLVCPFWDDVQPLGAEQVLYYADAQTGQFVMSWIGCTHYFQTGDVYSFQIVLDESGGIYFNYLEISDGPTGNLQCTVGLENEDGTLGYTVCFDGQGAYLPETETSIAFWAGPSGEIAGLVREFSTNAPIQNAEISVEGGEDVAFSDASGNYVLEVDPGTYTMNIHKQGYCDESIEGVVVEDDNTTTRNVTLRQPNVQFDVTSINMITSVGQNTSTTFEISNPTTVTICPVEYSITDNAAWLSCAPVSGSVANGAVQEITVNANVAGLTPGDHSAVINVTHNDNGSPTTIPVTLSIALAGEEPVVMPTEFAFKQNYPNPFNATTALQFDLPVESRVEISLFNVMGQEVGKPVSGVYSAGSHSVSFSADQLPSGMYLVRMNAGSFSAMNKMVLLK